MSKEEYRVGRTVIDKKSFDKTINTDFKFYTDPVPVEDTDTVEELFRLYEKLYLEVPLEGDLSHTTLIERSSELVQVDNTNEIIANWIAWLMIVGLLCWIGISNGKYAF